MTVMSAPMTQRLFGAATAMAVAMVALAPPASAAPGDLVLASTSDTGVKNDGYGYTQSLSADGGTVAFDSAATTLDPADTDEDEDVYVKDLTSGDIVVASTSDSGAASNGRSFYTSLSGDGTAVSFLSTATSLDPADTDVDSDIYVKDLVSGDIVLASSSDTGVKGNVSSEWSSLSADGSTVAFDTYASNLDPADTDVNSDVYVKNVITGDIVLASTSDTGVNGNGSCLRPSLSADGSTVAFMCQATNLDAADTDTNLDVYVKDLASGDIVLASTSDTGAKSDGFSSLPSLSDDGTTVAFAAFASNLDPGADGDRYDVYVKTLSTGDLMLASTSDSGVAGNQSSHSPSLSADGTTVAFFSAATNLDPADTDTGLDVYRKDLASGDIVLVSTSAAGVKGNEKSYDPSMSADGAAVAFRSMASNLDPADSDTLTDVYVKKLAQPVTISITDRSQREGDRGRTRFLFQLTLSSPSSIPVTVDVATADGTALAGSDYLAGSGTVTFAPGETTKRVPVRVVGDTLVEPRESFTVVLSNPSGALIADDQGSGRIRNDD